MRLKDVGKLLKGCALRNKAVNEYADGDIYNNLNSGEHKYGFVNLTINNIRRTENTMVVSCYLFYVDRLLEDNSNKMDIYGTGCDVLQQILVAVEHNAKEYFNYGEMVFTNFTEKFSDLCAGVYASVDIEFLNNVDKCDDDYEPEGFYEDVTFNHNGTFKLDGKYNVNVNVAEGYDILKLRALEDSAVAMTISRKRDVKLKYSIDNYIWHDWDLSEIDLDAGETLYLKGGLGKGTIIEGWATFVMTGKIEAYGKISSIAEDYDDVNKAMYFRNLFNDCHALKRAPELDVDIVLQRGFEKMFAGTGIAEAPIIDMEFSGSSICKGMFSGCTDLVKAQNVFPQKYTGNDVYYGMFKGCENLEISPVLYAIAYDGSGKTYNLGVEGMFDGCPKVKTITTFFYTDSLVLPSITDVEGGTWYNLGNSYCPGGNRLVPDSWTEYKATRVE